MAKYKTQWRMNNGTIYQSDVDAANDTEADRFMAQLEKNLRACDPVFSLRDQFNRRVLLITRNISSVELLKFNDDNE